MSGDADQQRKHDHEDEQAPEPLDRQADTLPTDVPSGDADTLPTAVPRSDEETLSTRPPSPADSLLTAMPEPRTPVEPGQGSDPHAPTLPLEPQTDRHPDAAGAQPLDAGEPPTAATGHPGAGYRRQASQEATLLAQEVDQPGTGALRRDSGVVRRAGTVMADADGVVRGTARTVRVNPRLPRETQTLDERLQLSRHSVYVQMLQQRGPGELPPTVRLRLEGKETIGRYTVERPLAAGGMGAVLAIADEDFNRQSAMKVMHARFAHQPESLERFLEEAQITAQLEHPNIVPVHDVGMTTDGTLYYTMKLIHGTSMAKIIEGRRAGDAQLRATWSDEHVLMTFLKVLEGMGYAHSQGVIHRDIKPDNIMIEAHGEVLVVDWGIAKLLAPAGGVDEVESLASLVKGIRDEDSLSATRTGTAIGTPYYMPPEQAIGDKAAMGMHSDIYALGVTLYELLTGERPITAETVPAMLPMILSGSCRDIKHYRPDLHDDLAAIVHKAMALEPARRYADCETFAEDIRRYLTGRAVAARQRNWVERLGAWIKAHRRQVQAGAALLLVAVLGIGGTVTWQRRQAQQRADDLLTTLAERLPAADDPAALTELRAKLVEARTLVPDHGRLGELTDRLATAQAAIELRAASREAAARITQARELLAQAAEQHRALPELDRTAVLAAEGEITDFTTACRALLATPDGLLARAGAAYRAARETGAAMPPGVDDDLRQLGAMVQDVEQRLADAEGLAADHVAARELLAAARELQAGGEPAAALSKVEAAAERFRLPGLGAFQRQLEADLADSRRATLRRQAVADLTRARELLDQSARLPADDRRRQTLLDRTAEALATAAQHGDMGILPDGLNEAVQRLAVLRERGEAARRRAANLQQARQQAAAAMAEARKAAAALPAIEQDIAELETDIEDAMLAVDGQAERRQALQARLLAAEKERRLQASTMRRAAQAVVEALAGHPQDTLLVAAHRLLAEDALASYQRAFTEGDPVAAELAMNLLRTHDREGRLMARLTAPGRLRIEGAGASLALPLQVGPDTRLVVDRTADAVPISGERVDLPPGTWRLGDRDRGLIWYVAPDSDGRLHLPAERHITIAVPGVEAAITADYLPAGDGGQGVYLSRFEITNLQYFPFVHSEAALARIREHDRRLRDGQEVGPLPIVSPYWQRVPDRGPLERFRLERHQADWPVNGIDRAAAMAFCSWLSEISGHRIRLPSRAEWRMAAAGGDPQRRWPWGPVFDPAFCLSAHDGLDHPAPVGSRPADRGPFGHRDLAGGLREWLLDSERRGGNFHGALVAGGGWGDHRPERFAADAVESVHPEGRFPVFGFRICIEP